jgi:hypothetical protein
MRKQGCYVRVTKAVMYAQARLITQILDARNLRNLRTFYSSA